MEKQLKRDRELALEYGAISNVQDRARWLLRRGITARLTVHPEKLEWTYQAFSGRWALPGYFGSVEEAVVFHTNRLAKRAGIKSVASS